MKLPGPALIANLPQSDQHKPKSLGLIKMQFGEANLTREKKVPRNEPVQKDAKGASQPVEPDSVDVTVADNEQLFQNVQPLSLLNPAMTYELREDSFEQAMPVEGLQQEGVEPI